MSKAGVSILLRAGNNKQAAQQFLQQLVKANTLHPIEVVLLFNEPEAKHLQLFREFVDQVPLVIRPAKGRTFANMVPQLRYDTVLVLTTPLDWQADLLPKTVKQLCNNNVMHLLLETPKQALLVKREAMADLAEYSLLTAPNRLQQALLGKAAPVPKPAAKPVQSVSTPSSSKTKPQAQTQKPSPVPGIKAVAKGSTKPQAEPAAKRALDSSRLDKQIIELENELEQLDQSLTTQYQEIDELDKHCVAMEGKGAQNSQEVEQLKAQLKERVFKANDTLKTLKSQHDELERLRINRYSILA